MKVVIFAGGSGRRLWPISLKSSPKQFEPIIGEKSTLQLAVDRVVDVVGAENVFISTNERYIPLVSKQLPMLPTHNFIGEPMRRDLAAAVGLAITHILHHGEEDEPLGILWGDNYMERVPTFQKVLRSAEKIIDGKRANIVFMGETPRFANDNLGWIGLGQKMEEVDGLDCYAFDSLTYRPPLADCQQMFANKTHVWNTGYFVTTPGYVWQQYAKFQPSMHGKLAQIRATIGSDAYADTLSQQYPTLDELSFDDAVLTHLAPTDVQVLYAEMGWSDPGTLYALKEAIEPDPTKNVTRGLIVNEGSQDCLLYNDEAGKLLAVIGLEGMVVVNTEKSILVVHKDQIPLVKKLVNSMVGTELESYT